MHLHINLAILIAAYIIKQFEEKISGVCSPEVTFFLCILKQQQVAQSLERAD